MEIGSMLFSGLVSRQEQAGNVGHNHTEEDISFETLMSMVVADNYFPGNVETPHIPVESEDCPGGTLWAISPVCKDVKNEDMGLFWTVPDSVATETSITGNSGDERSFLSGERRLVPSNEHFVPDKNWTSRSVASFAAVARDTGHENTWGNRMQISDNSGNIFTEAIRTVNQQLVSGHDVKEQAMPVMVKEVVVGDTGKVVPIDVLKAAGNETGVVTEDGREVTIKSTEVVTEENPVFFEQNDAKREVAGENLAAVNNHDEAIKVVPTAQDSEHQVVVKEKEVPYKDFSSEVTPKEKDQVRSAPTAKQPTDGKMVRKIDGFMDIKKPDSGQKSSAEGKEICKPAMESVKKSELMLDDKEPAQELTQVVSQSSEPVVTENKTNRISLDSPDMLARFLRSKAHEGLPKSVQITLDPPELGNLRVFLTARGQDVSVRFVTSNYVSYQALQGAANDLAKSFSGHGLMLAGFVVDHGSREHGGSDSDSSERRLILNKRHYKAPVSGIKEMVLTGSSGTGVFDYLV